MLRLSTHSLIVDIPGISRRSFVFVRLIREPQGGKAHVLEAMVPSIILTGILGQEGLLVFNLEMVLVEPNRHTLSRKPLLDIEIKALHTDKTIAIDGPGELHLLEHATELLWGNELTSFPR